jgi:sugar lactone lactonase YvrE
MKLLFCLLSIGLLSAQALRTVPFKLVRIDPALDAIVTADAKLEILGEHFGLTEGPVWIREGNSGYLLFSDCAANVIYKWSPTQPLSVFLERSGFTGTNNLNAGQQTIAGRLAILLIGRTVWRWIHKAGWLSPPWRIEPWCGWRRTVHARFSPTNTKERSSVVRMMWS